MSNERVCNRSKNFLRHCFVLLSLLFGGNGIRSVLGEECVYQTYDGTDQCNCGSQGCFKKVQIKGDFDRLIVGADGDPTAGTSSITLNGSAVIRRNLNANASSTLVRWAPRDCSIVGWNNQVAGCDMDVSNKQLLVYPAPSFNSEVDAYVQTYQDLDILQVASVSKSSITLEDLVIGSDAQVFAHSVEYKRSTFSKLTQYPPSDQQGPTMVNLGEGTSVSSVFNIESGSGSASLHCAKGLSIKHIQVNGVTESFALDNCFGSYSANGAYKVAGTYTFRVADFHRPKIGVYPQYSINWNYLPPGGIPDGEDMPASLTVFVNKCQPVFVGASCNPRQKVEYIGDVKKADSVAKSAVWLVICNADLKVAAVADGDTTACPWS